MSTSWWQLTMSPSGSKLCHARQPIIEAPRRCSKRQYFQDSGYQGSLSVIEDPTSSVKAFNITCRSMGSSITLLLPIILRQADKQRHQISKLRIFYRRRWMRWEPNGKIDSLKHFGLTGQPTKHQLNVTIPACLWEDLSLAC